MSPDERRGRKGLGADRGRARGWRVVRMEVPVALADEVTGRLAPWILGAEHEAAGPASTRIRLFLRSSPGAAEVRGVVRRALEAFGLDAGDCGLRVERIADGRWVERYQAALRPIALGARFTVLPAGAGAPAAGREAILLTPGRAFGTGEHATTQLCAEQLERRVQTGSRWVDLGCGTGILSIVAARSGAREVLALDNDPEAIDVASDVLAANGLGGGVRLEVGSIERAEGGGWSGIVANIHAPFFLERGAALHDALQPGGLLVASGFSGEQADEVAAALERAALHAVERRTSGPWVVWVGRRARGGGGS